MAIQLIISQVGPLPITANFNAIGDEPMYLEVNGSVYSSSPNTTIGIAISLDGQAVASAQIFSNGIDTHRTVVPAYVPIQLAQGQHSLTLSASNTVTIGDANDVYTAVIHY